MLLCYMYEKMRSHQGSKKESKKKIFFPHDNSGLQSVKKPEPRKPGSKIKAVDKTSPSSKKFPS